MIIDISPLVDEHSAVFPGDEAFSRQQTLSFEAGDNLALSHITTSLHTGAHADAPSHYNAQGESIEQRSLDYYYGPCQVIEIKGQPECITQDDLLGQTIDTPRILFKTGSFPDRTAWRDDFSAVSPEFIDWLAEQDIRLIGIDTPSVDPASAKNLIAHHTIYRHDLAILENLELKHVSPGHYTLLALPLKLTHAEAAPVRAALIAD